ncbi:MAG TPA: SOS response-associated peptidase [Clostridiaceae bacterium]|nr:SOS response-associated peptidase [Clostridiaceae bacterium]
MCGRYLVLTDEDYEEMQNIIDIVSKNYKESSVAKGEVFPTNNIPVIYSHNGKKVLSAAKWGFPSYKGSGVIINARAESVHEKPMFRNAFISNRCIVPANGYYEWLTHEDKSKTKYLIGVKGKRLFFMAGLYNMFTDKNNNPYTAITIITTEASEEISFIHDRMPVILPDEAINSWLDKNNRDIDLLRSMLVPFSSAFSVTEVS